MLASWQLPARESNLIRLLVLENLAQELAPYKSIPLLEIPSTRPQEPESLAFDLPVFRGIPTQAGWVLGPCSLRCLAARHFLGGLRSSGHLNSLQPVLQENETRTQYRSQARLAFFVRWSSDKTLGTSCTFHSLSQASEQLVAPTGSPLTPHSVVILLVLVEILPGLLYLAWREYG